MSALPEASLGRLAAVLAAVLAAAPAAAQSAAAAPSAPGWIGVSASLDQEWPSGGDPVVVVLAVADGSPAARAGLAEGDTLLLVDGAPLTGERLRALQVGLRAGDRVEITVRRAGGSRTLRLRAGTRPAPEPVEAPLLPAGGQRWVFIRAPEAPAAPDFLAPEFGTPFTVHVYRDARTDSLIVALQQREKELVRVRSAESQRLTELARSVSPGGRVDAADPALTQLRRRREALANEVALVRATLEAVAAERASEPFTAFAAPDGAWSVAPANPAEASRAVTIVSRAMTPYIAGRDRVAGARLTTMNDGLAEYFDNARGLLVVEVAPGTPAAEAGLRPGDVLLRVGRTDVDDLDALRRAVAEARAEQPLAVTVLRRGSRVQLTLPR